MSKSTPTMDVEPQIFIKGGILFEQIRETPVTINAPTVLFKRALNFTTYGTAITQLLNFTHRYKTYCDKLQNRVQTTIKQDLKDKYFVSPYDINIGSAEHYCLSKNARLPEIRDQTSYKEVLSLARENGISTVPAGILPDYTKHIFIFKSDKANAYIAKNFFPSIFFYYKNNTNNQPCTVGNKGGYFDDPGCVSLQKGDLPLSYFKDGPHWKLTILHERYKSETYKVICENYLQSQMDKFQQTLLIRMASNACQRDLFNVKQATKLVTAETTMFVKIDDSKLKDLDRLDKRSDDFEFETFSNQLIDPGTFCSIYDKEFYTTICDRFEDFHIKLMEVVKNISIKTQIPDTFIAGYITQQLISITELIKVKNVFNPCTTNFLLENIDHKQINEDISRLISLAIAISHTCDKWHDSSYNDYYFEQLRKPEIAFMFLPIFDAFYNLGFTRPKSPSGKSLLAFNENISKLRIDHLNFTRHNKNKNFVTLPRHDSNILHILNDSNIEYLDLTNETVMQMVIAHSYLHPLIRKKRWAAAAVASVLAVDAVQSLSKGEAPFSGFGRWTSKLTGLVHQSDIRPYLELLEKHSKVLQTLDFNQQELEKAYESMASSMDLLDDNLRQLEFSTATLFQEIDFKTTHQNLINTITHTLTKLAILITNAQTKNVSPFLISRDEMKQIATEYRSNNIFLSDNLNDAEAAYVYYDDHFIFSISMPVLNEKDKYHVYKASKIPIFTKNGIFEAEIDTNYVAYSITSNTYRILTEEEFSYCKYFKFCKTADVERPIKPSSHCVIKTISKQNSECPLKESTLTEPFYHINGNNLIYSVGGPQPTTLICENNPIRKTIYLEGMGIAKIESGCKILFENDMIAYINPEPEIVDLGQIKFMEVFKYTPNINDFNVEIVYANKSITHYKPNITTVDTSSFEHIWNEIKNPSQVIPEIIRVLAGIFIFVVLFSLLCCCSKRFAIWFKSCTFWKNPRTYWVDYRNYDLGTFNKYKPAFDRRKNQFMDNFRRLFTLVASESPKQDDTESHKGPIIKNARPIEQPTTLIAKLRKEENNYKQQLETDKLIEQTEEKTTSSIYPKFSYVTLPQNQGYVQTYLPAPRYDDLDTQYLQNEMNDIRIVLEQPMSQYQHQMFAKDREINFA